METEVPVSDFNNPYLNAQNCDELKDIFGLSNPGDYFLEPKYDGFRLLCVVDTDSVGMFTRSLKRQDGKLPWQELEILRTFPPGTVLDGEIVATKVLEDGKVENRFEYVQSVMLSNVDRSVAVQRASGALHYVIFDVLTDGAKDFRAMPLESRRNWLAMKLNDRDLGNELIAISEVFPATKEVYDTITGMGFEGVVLKRRDSTYVGERGKGWYKIKMQPEVDCIIIDFTPGNGKYTGQIGSVIFGQPNERGELTERGQCSGMTDQERLYMTANQADLIGKVIGVTNEGIYPKSKRFRHPQFVRFRPDKPRADVIWDDGRS